MELIAKKEYDLELNGPDGTLRVSEKEWNALKSFLETNTPGRGAYQLPTWEKLAQFSSVGFVQHS